VDLGGGMVPVPTAPLAHMVLQGIAPRRRRLPLHPPLQRLKPLRYPRRVVMRSTHSRNVSKSWRPSNNNERRRHRPRATGNQHRHPLVIGGLLPPRRTGAQPRRFGRWVSIDIETGDSATPQLPHSIPKSWRTTFSSVSCPITTLPLRLCLRSEPKAISLKRTNPAKRGSFSSPV